MSDTPWEAGRFDGNVGPKRILFGRMYEDVAVEETAFTPGSRIFCIASAGCTALALAGQHQVTAVDINPAQLAYAQERAAGSATQIGSAERVLALGRPLLALFGWRRQRLTSFLALEDPAEQMAFWNQHLNRIAIRGGANVFLSVSWLRLVYAAPFLQVVPPRFGRVMWSRLERCWRTHPNRSNPYARALLLGESAPVWDAAVGSRVRFVCADAASFLESSPAASFDGFTLSNILDGVPENYRRRLFAAIRRAAAPGATVVLRSFGEPPPGIRTNHAARDRSILWGVVDVRPASAL